MIKFGLCCIFRKEPIRFRRTTHKYINQFSRQKQLEYLSEIILHNANSLLQSLEFCNNNGIDSFRGNSAILPLKTHPISGYEISDLPDADMIINTFNNCGKYSQKNNIRTTFHPDQFNVLASPTPDVVERSVNELKYQAEVSELINADVINIHIGGIYNDKKEALKRFFKEVEKLPDNIRSRLTVENDDKMYTPQDLIQLSKDLELPLVYDVHHHRVFSDNLAVEQATELALSTWNREPLFHISSPKNGWNCNNAKNHNDYVDPDDFPRCWLDLDITVEVEAKAKELAVLKLKNDISDKILMNNKDKKSLR